MTPQLCLVLMLMLVLSCFGGAAGAMSAVCASMGKARAVGSEDMDGAYTPSTWLDLAVVCAAAAVLACLATGALVVILLVDSEAWAT